MAGLMDFSDEDREDVVDMTVTDDQPEGTEPEGGDEETAFDSADLIRQALLTEDDYEDEEDGQTEDQQPESGGTSEDENLLEPDDDTDQSFKTEENARNAERRRQQEQAIAERLKAEAPEYLLAQRMAALSGKSVEQLTAELQEAELAQKAKQQGVPLEVARKIHEYEQKTTQLEQKLMQIEFNNWVSRIDQEATALQSNFTMLTDDDMKQAKEYLLQNLKNPELPLEQAVFALHGKKIMDSVRDNSKNEALAEASGRKAKATPTPKASKNPDIVNLTPEQKAAAELFGMSEDEYIKWMN